MSPDACLFLNRRAFSLAYAVRGKHAAISKLTYVCTTSSRTYIFLAVACTIFAIINEIEIEKLVQGATHMYSFISSKYLQKVVHSFALVEIEFPKNVILRQT